MAKVIKSDTSTESFPGSGTGTTVTLPPGEYTVIETPPVPAFGNPSFSGDCSQHSVISALGNIKAGQTQKCTVTNTQQRI